MTDVLNADQRAEHEANRRRGPMPTVTGYAEERLRSAFLDVGIDPTTHTAHDRVVVTLGVEEAHRLARILGA